MSERTSCLTASTLSGAALCIALSCSRAAWADAAGLPIREVTIFKDGHALVMHSGEMAVDAHGRVTLDDLPAPVLGTFWPFALDDDAKLVSVTAGQRLERIERTALTVREMLEGNIGGEVLVQEVTGEPYAATIVEIPVRHPDELEATDASTGGAHVRVPVSAQVIVLRTEQGLRVIPIDRIMHVVFKNERQPKVVTDEVRPRLTLALAWNGAAQPSADVGMMYLQKGLRWIPNYKVEIDGAGKAIVTLQATIINELADLEGVTTHLVIGVPQFAFKDTLDPMSMQQVVAQLSPYFDQGQTGQALSNAIMSQSARMGEYRAAPPNAGGGPGDGGPEVTGEGANEDLFVFTVSNITLARGERMVLPVTSFALEYRDHYTLDLPVAPPVEVRYQFNSPQLDEIGRMLRAPKVMHNLCMRNTSKAPLTTAPALIMKNGSVLSQGMMTYTAVGAEVKLPMTAAVDIRHKRSDVETARVPDAFTWRSNRYGRVDFDGTITLTNFKDQPVQIEVTRHVLGNAVSANMDGKAEMVNMLEEGDAGIEASLPTWWRWYSWPYWWYRFNGLGRVTWNVTIEPGKDVELKYQWNYVWE